MEKRELIEKLESVKRDIKNCYKLLDKRKAEKRELEKTIFEMTLKKAGFKQTKEWLRI